MKLFKKLRKGFTLIELVVVIAVIAVLAAVSVVSYIAITNNAHKSNDQQLIDQVNLSLKSHEISKKPATMHEALLDVEEDGFIPANFKITPEFKGYRFAYNLKDNQFVILNESKAIVYPKDARKDAAHHELWLFADKKAEVEGEEKDYSHYLRGTGLSGEFTCAAGLDLGYNKGISKVNYSTTGAQGVVLRLVGDQTKLAVDAAQSDVDFYGFAKKMDITAIKSESMHIYGTVYQLEVTSGHVEVENTGIVFSVEEVGASASVTNAGYIAEAAAGVTVSGKPAGGDYEINSLDRLEGFRDAVNAGNNFAGLTIKLTQDISLKDGWQPIGEGTRSVAKLNTEAQGQNTFFSGTFDGQNHTISNLNNKGFEPTSARVFTSETPNHYSYGLFALVKNATFKNVKLRSVDIDQSRFSGAIMDSVAALVGYSEGTLTVENITVSGSIKGGDSVCGVVGRINIGANAISVLGCTNEADITASSGNKWAAGVLRCYRPAVGNSVTLKNNTNTGTVTGTVAAGVCAYNDAGTTADPINVAFTLENNTSNGAASTPIKG